MFAIMANDTSVALVASSIFSSDSQPILDLFADGVRLLTTPPENTRQHNHQHFVYVFVITRKIQ